MADIIYVKGDATRPQGDGMKFIIHICNDLGKWGAGFVIALSKRWPAPEGMYRKWFNTWHNGTIGFDFAMGMIQFCPVAEDITVINMIAQSGISDGKEHNPKPISYHHLRVCLYRAFKVAQNLGATIHMPRIGCGLAGGDWGEVELIIETVQAAYDINVTVYDL